MRPAEPRSVRPSAGPRGIGGRIRAHISDLLLPQHCVVCGEFGVSLHPACLDAFALAEGSRCVRCWRPTRTTWCDRCAEGGRADGGGPEGTEGATGGTDAPAFDALRTPFRFEGHARRAILEAKFRGITAHLPVLAQAAAGAIPAEWRFDVVVPVPLTRARRRTRGYNQAEVLARHVARATGAALRTRLLVRSRHAPPQATLTAEQRARNLDGVFAVRGVPPPSVLVVDDVTTTGATLSTAASVLKSAGAERVYGLAVARED